MSNDEWEVIGLYLVEGERQTKGILLDITKSCTKFYIMQLLLLFCQVNSVVVKNQMIIKSIVIKTTE